MQHLRDEPGSAVPADPRSPHLPGVAVDLRMALATPTGERSVALATDGGARALRTERTE